MNLFHFPSSKRDRAAAEAFAVLIDQGGSAPATRETLIARAMRPEQPLNEARRARMRDAMFAAFDASCSGDARTTIASLDAPEVATAEVLTEYGSVRMADVENISEARAQEIAEAALRRVRIVKGEMNGFGTDRRF